jgi:hypothetical protein
MASYLVRQLRFARSEFIRCLEGVTNEEGQQQVGQMNSISWIVGHLANHEHFLWVVSAQDEVLFPELHEVVGYGKPANAPLLDEMWDVWQQVTACADEYLDTLSEEMMVAFLSYKGKPLRENIGTTLMRNTYHIFISGSTWGRHMLFVSSWATNHLILLAGLGRQYLFRGI